MSGTAQGDRIVEAREALNRKDGKALAVARAAAIAADHPLAMWADYFELSNRLAEAQQSELDAFYARWPGTYVEDRLRNDWLLELGKRRNWANFAVEYPRFRMNDGREVRCYALMLDQQAGKDVRKQALEAWLAQRDADDGCALMAATLVDAKQLGSAEVWRKERFAVDAGRPKAARQAVALLSVNAASSVGELTDNPMRYLARSASASSRPGAELATLALMRLATNDPDAAALQLDERWERASRPTSPPGPGPQQASRPRSSCCPASIKSRQDAAPTKRNQLIWKVFGCFVEKTALLSIGRSKQKDTRTPKHKTPNPQTPFNKNSLDFKSSSKYDPCNFMPETVSGY